MNESSESGFLPDFLNSVSKSRRFRDFFNFSQGFFDPVIIGELLIHFKFAEVLRRALSKMTEFFILRGKNFSNKLQPKMV